MVACLFIYLSSWVAAVVAATLPSLRAQSQAPNQVTCAVWLPARLGRLHAQPLLQLLRGHFVLFAVD